MSGVGDDSATTSDFKSLKKAHFVTVITEYSEKNSKGWEKKDIEAVVNSLLEEEKKYKLQIKVDDGSRQLSLFGGEKEFAFDIKSATQNLFFLHGAFHIYKDGKSVKKITQTDKALYDRVEDILNTEDRELVCIFQTINKKDEIEKNAYLTKCLSKLNTFSGDMVIIGSSLDDNDDHVFNEIRKSRLDTLYISTVDELKSQMHEKAVQKFPSKSIDWTIKESVRAKLKVIIKRTLRQFGYPPDMQKLATETVLKQDELIASEITGD
jgi:hypothetical protein